MDIAVVIPTYNRASLIGHTLRAIAAQSLPPREVIVVDDGSTDETEAVVRSVGDLPIAYARLANGGPSRARNVGVSMAASPWIAFCDSDDLWQPGYLARQAELIAAAPGIRAAFCNSVYVVGDAWQGERKFDAAPAGFWDPPLWSRARDRAISTGSLLERFFLFQPVYPSAFMIARDFFGSAGGYEERFGRNPAEDAEFVWRCVRSHPIGALMEPLVGIRKHEANFSGSALKTALGAVEIFEHALATYDLSPQERAVAARECGRHRRAAFDHAFAAGRYGLARKLFGSIPEERRSWRTYAKNLIALARGLGAPARRAAGEG